MPNYSKRGKLAPKSPIRKLAPYAVRAKEKGIKVYHLNIGQPDIESPLTAIQALNNLNLKLIAYTESEGLLCYRQVLSEYYQSLGIKDITPDNFIVCNGASEAIEFTVRCICDKDDEIIIPEPFYANYVSFTSAFDIKTIAVTSHLEDSFALPPIKEFEKKITDKTRAILICNPGNPTGYLYSKEELEELTAIALRHNIFLIADEVYREFVYDGLKHHSILEFPEISELAIVIDSESKRYNLCGLRIGSIVTRNKELLKIVMKFAQARLSASRPGQIVATAAHKEDQEYLYKTNKEYAERRNLLADLFNEIPNVRFNRPEGAFYYLVELPVDDAEKFSIWMLEHFSIDNETTMLAPAAGFYSTHTLGIKQVRIAYVLNKKDLEKAIFLLKKGLEEYNKLQENKIDYENKINFI